MATSSNGTGRPAVYQVYDNLRPETLTSSPLVDLELHPLLSYIIRDFIANWFTSISGDEELLLEFIKSLSILVRNMEFRFCKVDWVSLLTKDFVEALRIHMSDFKRCKSRLNSSYAGSASLEDLFHGLQPHVALLSDENEHEYCRKVADIFLESFFPPKELDSDVIRYLMREIMSETVLLSAFDAISEPETIFYLLNCLLEVMDPMTTTTTHYTAPMSSDNLGASRSLNVSGILGPSTSEAPNQPISSGLKRDLSLAEMARSHPELSEPPLPTQSGIQSFFGDMGQAALFRFNPQQSSSFLRRKKAPPVVATKSPTNPAAVITNSLVAGMNKITFGGFDKVSSGLDRLKTIVKPSDKDILNPVKRFGTRKRTDKSVSPEKEKRRMSFKMSNKRRTSEGGILDSPTSFIQRFAPKFEPSRSRLRADSTVDEGHISDSAVLRGGSYTDSPVSMTHRRLKSDMGSMLRQESSIREDTPTLHNSAIDRVREMDAMSETESEASSVEDLELEDNISQDVLGPAQFTPSVHHLAPMAPQHNLPKTSDSFYDLWKTFMYLITESRMGPSKIGLIDLSRYSHVQLEDGFLELADEIFNLSERYHWSWTQSLFFTRPVINHFFRNLINRTIAKGVYQVVNPPMVSFLVRRLRDKFWPNGVWRTPPIPSTSDEKARIQVEASLRLFSFCQKNMGSLLGAQVIQESVDDIMGAFQSKRVNKHLVYVLLDILLVHLAPEISLSKTNKTRYA